MTGPTMFDPAKVTDPSVKKAAINWLLAYGEVNDGNQWTGSALADIQHRGIDYERSDMPQHLLVEIENEEVGKVGERVGVLAASVVFADAPERARAFSDRDYGVVFVMPRGAMDHYVMASAIGLPVTRGGDFTSVWRSRVHTPHYDRLVEQADRDRAREHAALAARGEE